MGPISTSTRPMLEISPEWQGVFLRDGHPARRTPTWDNAKSWLIFDSLDQAETYNTSSSTVGGLYFTGSNNIARNLSAARSVPALSLLYIGATNNTVTNVTAFNSTAPRDDDRLRNTGNIVQNSTFTMNTTCARPLFTRASWAVIVRAWRFPKTIRG